METDYNGKFVFRNLLFGRSPLSLKKVTFKNQTFIICYKNYTQDGDKHCKEMHFSKSRLDVLFVATYIF